MYVVSYHFWQQCGMGSGLAHSLAQAPENNHSLSSMIYKMHNKSNKVDLIFATEMNKKFQ